MRDELESERLAFVPADHSDSCSKVIDTGLSKLLLSLERRARQNK